MSTRKTVLGHIIVKSLSGKKQKIVCEIKGKENLSYRTLSKKETSHYKNIKGGNEVKDNQVSYKKIPWSPSIGQQAV